MEDGRLKIEDGRSLRKKNEGKNIQADLLVVHGEEDVRRARNKRSGIVGDSK